MAVPILVILPNCLGFNMKRYLLSIIILLLPLILSCANEQHYWLDQKMIDTAKGSFTVNKAYSLLNDTIVLPKGFKLIFDGGSLDDGVIIGNESSIEVVSNRPVLGLGITIKGIWNQKEVYDKWFVFNKDTSYVANTIIQNMLDLTDDNHHTHIYLNVASRVYRVELPYKGRADIATKFKYTYEGEKKKIDYSDVYDDCFSFFRIFTIPSNTHFTINNSIEMMPTNQGAYFMFWEYGKENITIDGKGTIAGEARKHIYTTPFIGKTYYGEWGMLFNCFKCKNFVFRDVTLTDAFGDCLYFEGAYRKQDMGDRRSDGLIMDNVTIRYARRNGVSIGARNVHIKNCTFECCGIDEIRGTRPRSAIDFEADGIRNYPEIGNENVLMEDCIFRNNFSDITACRNNLPNYGKTATIVKNCVVTSSVKMSSANWLTFENCIIPKFAQSTNTRLIYWNCSHLTFQNCSFGTIDREVLLLADKYKNSYKDCSFEKLVDSK
jgi:hypothetical protein